MQEPPERDPAGDESAAAETPKNVTMPTSNGQLVAAIATPSAAMSAASIRNLGSSDARPDLPQQRRHPDADQRHRQPPQIEPCDDAEAAIAAATNIPNSAAQIRFVFGGFRNSANPARGYVSRRADRLHDPGSAEMPPQIRIGKLIENAFFQDLGRSERSVAQTDRAVSDKIRATPISCSPSTFQ